MIKRAGTERGTSSIIKSGQKDTEASIQLFEEPAALVVKLYQGFLRVPVKLVQQGYPGFKLFGLMFTKLNSVKIISTI